MNRDILVLTRDHIGARMASPGIRMYNIARTLAQRLPNSEITLAVAADSQMGSQRPPFRVVPYKRSAVVTAAFRSDILISNYFPPYLYPFMTHKRVVLDLFSPFTERLEVARSKGHGADAFFSSYTRGLISQLLLTDLVLCASERQRDLYFGMLSAIGRVMPDTYDHDHWLSNLIALAPFGVRDGEPKATRRVLRDVWPGIHAGDTILIWNGVIIEWYDLVTLIHAIARISQQRSDIKLFFLGTEHPDNPGAPKLQGLGGGTVRAALQLCQELKLLDRFVFFNFDWVDYEDTVNYLAEADIGICTYFDNIETRFAFRSRYADLLWAELPIICTQGDVWAESVDSRPLGVAVPERDEDSLVHAILRLADDTAFAQRCKNNLREERERYRWHRVLERLVCYCQDATAAPAKWQQLPALATMAASNQTMKLRDAGIRRLVQLYHLLPADVRPSRTGRSESAPPSVSGGLSRPFTAQGSTEERTDAS
jgi:glycosyltransferase involved in cell wall biosynthesis